MGRLPEQGTHPVGAAAALAPLAVSPVLPKTGWGQQRGAGKEQQGSIATLLPAQEQGAKSWGPLEMWLGLTPWAPRGAGEGWAPSGLLRVLLPRVLGVLLPTQGSVGVPRAVGTARGQDCHCHSLSLTSAATGTPQPPGVSKVVCGGQPTGAHVDSWAVSKQSWPLSVPASCCFLQRLLLTPACPPAVQGGSTARTARL